MILDAPGQSWFIFKKHKQIYIFGVSGVMFDMKDSLKGLEESASHPPPSTRGSAPSFDDLSHGIDCVSLICRELLKYRHTFVKIMKNCQKLMFPKLTQEHSGDVQGPL